MHAPFVFSSIQPYLPVAIAVFFFNLELAWGYAPPPLRWSVPQDSHCYKLSPLQGCWASAATPGLLQRACLFTVRELSGAQGALPSLLHVFFFFSCLFIIQIFFPWAVVSLFRGLCRFVLGFSVGVLHAAYLLTWGSVKQVRSWSLAAQEPSWFLHLTLIGDDIYRLGVWRCQNFASSWWFFLPGVSLVSLQDFTWRSMLSASSL
jgi:hypothetical protein